jgi:hypothetical protein
MHVVIDEASTLLDVSQSIDITFQYRTFDAGFDSQQREAVKAPHSVTAMIPCSVQGESPCIGSQQS